MLEIKFNYNGKIIPIQCNKNEKMKDIFDKIEKEIKNNSVYYLYQGNKINGELKLEEIINEDDINNINIIIYNIDETNKKKSKYVKCPKCLENIRIKFNDYKIKLYDCKNGHNIENISLEDYENMQKIDISKIICNICKVKNISQTYNNEFYFCITCKKNICPLCKLNHHNLDHYIINYEKKDYICELHNEIYIKYCNTCKKNICLSCHNMHKNHEKIQYEDIIPDMNEVGNNMKRLKNSLHIFKNDTKNIINQLKKVIENLYIYYNFSNNLIQNYKSKNRNYEILQNINEINKNNNIIINDINNINNDNIILNKLKEILNIYEKMKIYEITEKMEKSETQVTLNAINKKICINNINNMNNMNNNNINMNNMNNNNIDLNSMNNMKNLNNNNNIDLNCMNNMNYNNNIDYNSLNNMNNMNNNNIDLNSLNNMNNMNNNNIDLNSLNNMNNMNNMNNNNIDLNSLNNMNNNNNIDLNYMNNMNNINNNMIINNNDFNRMNNMKNIYNMNRMNNNIMNNFGFNNQNNMNNQLNPPNFPQFNNNDGKVINQKPKIIYPNKTGLKNIGNSSYMNSTIQCLSNINYLSDYLIKHYGELDVKIKPLSAEFSSLVYDLFTTEKDFIDPKMFKRNIGKLNPLFEGNQEVDAKELIIFLLGKLHQELNKCTSEKPKIDYDQLENDSFDENKMLQHFIKDYTGKNRSIISDTFYGIIRSTMKCNNCKMIKYSFKTFNFLIFKLKNVKEFIQKLLYKKNKYTLNIYDAFDCNRKEEFLDGDNKKYCSFCKNLTICVHQQFIYSLPKVLIIILDRGRNNQDFKKEFIFPKDLDLSIENYVILNNINTKFYLQSVITHFGDDVASGHFITYCRNGPNEDFLCYNDIVVSKVNMNEVMSSNFSKTGNEKRAPYILVYHSLE